MSVRTHFPSAKQPDSHFFFTVARGERHDLSVSVGGAIFRRGMPFNELYRAADERLCWAKQNGRNRVHSVATGAALAPPTVGLHVV